MSAIVISVVLLIIVTTSSFTGFYGRFNILDTELKARSAATADACVSSALLKASQGDTSATFLTLNSLDVCRATIPYAGAIRVQATSSNSAVTNLIVTYDTTAYTTTSYLETPYY